MIPTTDLERRLRERIVAGRQAIGASQADLAAHLRIADTTAISKIENGKRAVSSVELSQIADFCGKPLSWFFDDSPGVVPNFRGVDAGVSVASRRDVQWLAEFADAYAFLERELRETTTSESTS